MTAHEAASNLRWYYCLTEPCEWLAIWIGPHRHLLKDDGRVGIVVERLTSEDVARTSDERIQAYGRGELSGDQLTGEELEQATAAFVNFGRNLRAWRKDGERGGTSPSEWGEKR